VSERAGSPIDTAGRRGDAPPERWSWVDLRLAPAAATVWGATLLAPLLPVPVLAGAVPAAVAAAVWVSRRRRSPAAVVLLGVLAALAVTTATAAVREAARAASPLAEVAEGRRTVELQLELDGDPTAVRGVGPPRVVAEATVTALEDGGARTRLDDAVVLFGPADEWLGLLEAEGVTARAYPTGYLHAWLGMMLVKHMLMRVDPGVRCECGQRSPRPPRTRGWWPGSRRGRHRRCWATRRGCSGPPAACGRDCGTPPSGCWGRRRAGSCRAWSSGTPRPWTRCSSRTSGGRGWPI